MKQSCGSLVFYTNEKSQLPATEKYLFREIQASFLFQDNCPLNQSVLLSLIQQLGSKLHDRTEIKLKYLEEAVTHLDTSDASIEVRFNF